MLRIREYKDGLIGEESADPASISPIRANPDARIWVDADDPTDEELDILQKEFGLHPLSIEDSKHRGQRPKVEFFEGYFFVVLHAVRLSDQQELIDSELHVFAGKGFLLTLRYKPYFELDEVKVRLRRQPELTKEGGGFLLYALLDEAVDGYLKVVERYEDLSDDIEDAVFADEPNPDVQERIFKLKRQVTVFRRLVMPIREVLDLVQEQPGFVTDPLVPYYRDVADHIIRTLEFIDNIRDLLTSALEAQLSQVSNRLNVVMKQLTSWAAILLVPTLIAGIYGMNFQGMRELQWKYGYEYALGPMFASSVLLYWLFKRKGWL
jgi:magnesium transporter